MPVPTKLAEAKLLATYWDNYTNYLATLDDRQPNIGQGDPKPPQTELYIKPFGFDIGDTQYVSANGTASRWSSWKGNIQPYTKDTLPSGGSVLEVKVVPARIVIKEGLSTSKTVVSARTTKRKYVSRGGKAGSVPFGLNTATDDELDVFQIIRSAIKNNASFDAATMRVSRSKEKV